MVIAHNNGRGCELFRSNLRQLALRRFDLGAVAAATAATHLLRLYHRLVDGNIWRNQINHLALLRLGRRMVRHEGIPDDPTEKDGVEGYGSSRAALLMAVLSPNIPYAHRTRG